MALVSLCSFTHAEYQAVIGTANHNIKFVKWEDSDSIEGEWQNLAAPYDCTNWTVSKVKKRYNIFNSLKKTSMSFFCFKRPINPIYLE